MKYLWGTNIYDRDGDKVEDCVLAYIGDNTIVKFQDVDELQRFAEAILGSLKEIRENS